MKKTVGIFILDLIRNKEFGDIDKLLHDRYKDYLDLCKNIEDKKIYYPKLHFEIEKNKHFSFTDNLNHLIALELNFAKKLNLFDAIKPSCFVSSDDLGNELISFISNEIDIKFFVYMREFLSEDELEITFKIGYDDYYEDIDILLNPVQI